MKIKKYLKTSFIFLFTCSLLVSCNVDEVDVTRKPFVPGEVENPETIAQVIIKDPNFSILESLMRRIEAAAINPSGRIITNLNVPGNNTVFAPTDAAFTDFMQANNITDLNKLPIELVTSLVYYHIKTGKFLTTDLTTGFVPTQATRGTGTNLVYLSMYINTNSGVVLNNTAKVVSSNTNVNNGIIHTVDAVVKVPTVQDLIALNPETSSFAAAVVRGDTDLATPVVGDAIANTSASVTVFAPSNTAFINVLTELGISSIQDLPTTQVANITKIHVVSTVTTTPAISSNLFVSRTNAKLQTILAGTPGQINFNGTTRTIKDQRARTGNIVPLIDIQGSNGVLHTLDKVLLPLTL
ncbi:fasciclin domain-containing protein [Flavobacterium fluviatile]|uniref:fasciclin domain-containing protein n=1 Tax=Flavobacterium fluviatile TaxID=1862387 RepID=UPI0013D6FE01|nr:fasciclin domain-containing protein [Flavobacterium fluviatile]